jgi:Amt family ammonium transporter
MASFASSNISPRSADQSQFDKGDVSFILVCSALVLFMVPGLGFLYAGLARRKSALTLLWVVVASNSVVIFQWYFWGYSLAFSSTATNGFIGNLEHIGLRNVLNAPSPGSPLIPELLYSFYQLQFAAVTVGILVGAVAERGRVLPAMVVAFFWTTLVYCPIACWAWNVNGWAFKLGVQDYAGGGPVEIASGMGGLAYSLVLGRRSQRELVNFRPHNVSLVCMGTFMLWFGWIGFNAGSAFGANLRAAVAGWNTGIAGAVSGIVWTLLDYRANRKYTMVGFCSGTIAGLVAATPTSGFIPPWASIVLGILSGVCCNYATKLKHWIRVDDALDIFAEHGLAGMIGLLFNGLFSADYIISLDNVNTSVMGGLIQGNFRQLYLQGVYIAAVTSYAFVVTALIAKAVDIVPGLNLRGDAEAELVGMDDHDIGEFVQDFVEVRREFDTWNPPSTKEGANEKEETPKQKIVVAGDRHSKFTDLYAVELRPFHELNRSVSRGRYGQHSQSTFFNDRTPPHDSRNPEKEQDAGETNVVVVFPEPEPTDSSVGH